MSNSGLDDFRLQVLLLGKIDVLPRTCAASPYNFGTWRSDPVRRWIDHFDHRSPGVLAALR
jgi:hypothetical protein